MPFEIAESLNYIFDKFTKFPSVRTIIRNPFYTALLITIIIILTILFVFRNVDIIVDDDSNDTIFTLGLRTGVYSLFFIVSVLFMHNKSVISELNSKKGSSEMQDLFENQVRGGAMINEEENVQTMVEANTASRPGVKESLVRVIIPDFTK